MAEAFQLPNEREGKANIITFLPKHVRINLMCVFELATTYSMAKENGEYFHTQRTAILL